MAAGNKTFLGLAVPLFGEATIEQQTAATDIVTIQGATSQTGDFLVCADVDGDELFGIGAAGRLQLKVLTTRPTTGLTKGELMLLFHGSSPKLGVCTSTAANTIKLIRLRTKTFGRLTA